MSTRNTENSPKNTNKKKAWPPFNPRYADDTLQKRYPCPEFDDHIRFDDSYRPDGTQAHDYYVDGELWKGSVTSFYHEFFPEFETDKQITRMMSGKRWELSPYYGMTSTEIKDLWESIASDASERGSRVHAAIEYYYNEDEIGKEAIRRDHPTPDYGYFLNFQREVASQWEPFRTELRAFDRELRLAGSVDMLYWSPRSTPEHPLLIMYDWKRSKKVLLEEAHGWGKPPLSHLPHHDLSHYQIQLNIYKALIERNTAYRIESMWLGVFHPNQADYVTVRVPDLQKEVHTMFEIRLYQLQIKQYEEQLPGLARFFQQVNLTSRPINTV